jgi:hypothetical protein
LILLVSDTITGLFRLIVVIQSATPRNRWLKALASNKNAFDDFYDIAHVGHKFPRLNRDEVIWLKQRLGKANCQRRQYFRYCREHRERKGRDKDLTQAGEAASVSRKDEAFPLQKPTQTELGRKSQASGEKPPSTLDQTNASTLVVAQLEQGDNASDSGRTETSFATSLGNREIPDRSQIPDLKEVCKDDHPFECPFCCTILTIKSQRKWE